MADIHGPCPTTTAQPTANQVPNPLGASCVFMHAAAPATAGMSGTAHFATQPHVGASGVGMAAFWAVALACQWTSGVATQLAAQTRTCEPRLCTRPLFPACGIRPRVNSSPNGTPKCPPSACYPRRGRNREWEQRCHEPYHLVGGRRDDDVASGSAHLVLQGESFEHVGCVHDAAELQGAIHSDAWRGKLQVESNDPPLSRLGPMCVALAAHG